MGTTAAPLSLILLAFLDCSTSWITKGFSGDPQGNDIGNQDDAPETFQPLIITNSFDIEDFLLFGSPLPTPNQHCQSLPEEEFANCPYWANFLTNGEESPKQQLRKTDAVNEGEDVLNEGTTNAVVSYYGKYRNITREELLHFSGRIREAAQYFGVSVPTLKRICRHHGIPDWRNRKVLLGRAEMGHKMVAGNGSYISHENMISSQEPEKSSKKSRIQVGLMEESSVLPIQLQSEIALHGSSRMGMRTMNLKAMFGGDKFRLELCDTSGVDDLRRELAKRLKIEADAFKIMYLDNENDWITIICDEDLQLCFKIAISQGFKFITLLIQMT